MFKKTILLVSMLTVGSYVFADGEKTYKTACAGCHQADGSGTKGMYPPLSNRLAPWLQTSAGKEYVGQVILNGRLGQVKVGNDSYSGFMSAFPQLSNDDIAGVINYTATNLNKTSGYTPVAAKDVAAWRAAPKRGKALDTMRASLTK